MASRASSDLLLVGSLPASTTEEALRAGGELFGDLVFALPDGETGPRRMWAAYEHVSMLAPHPDVETVDEGAMPPRHVGQMPVLAVREGQRELRFDRWPRIDDAIESYGLFRAMRAEGVIPAHVRFQVALPFRTSISPAFQRSFSHDFPIMNIVGAPSAEIGTRPIDHLPDAPSGVDWAEDASEQTLSERGGEVVADVHAQSDRLAGRSDVESQPVAADDQQPRCSHGFPFLAARRHALANHLVEEKGEAEHFPAHPDVRADRPAKARVERRLHARAHHHG